MKIRLLVVLTALLMISGAADALEVEYKGFELYRGDDGVTNVCRPNEILVREYYLINDEKPDSLMLISTSPDGTVWGHFVSGYMEGSGYIDSNYCQTVEQLLKGKEKQTRFMNASGDMSNVVKFSIYYDSKKVLKAEEWGKKKRKRVRNRMKMD